jgi:NADPH-dependent curcumin reductase CurA
VSNQKNHEIRLKSRPLGLPTPDNFELAETPVPTPAAGQVLVRNSYISVDPYMRGRMVDRKSYVPPFQIGETLQGHAVGQVVASNGNSNFKVGDHVQSMNGWREWFVSSGADLQKFEPAAPLQSYLGALGMPGMTAYAGLLRIGALKDGERVFVSAASGAVGSIVCQIAKAKGCYVVGSVGLDEKAQFLKSVGVDQTINYKTCGDLNAAVTRAFPEGIDVYFENVGGAHLEAAINNMRQFGRIALCGMIDMYNATEPPPGPRNLAIAIGLGLTLRGFVVSSHYDMLADFHRDMARWAKEGKMKWRETVVDGVENSPAAFIGLFKGDNLGKMVVRVGPDKAV